MTSKNDFAGHPVADLGRVGVPSESSDSRRLIQNYFVDLEKMPLTC